MTPSLRFFIELTTAYLSIIAAVDLAFAFGWLPGGTISRSISGLAAAHPWLPTAYLAACQVLFLLGYLHFFGRP